MSGQHGDTEVREPDEGDERPIDEQLDDDERRRRAAALAEIVTFGNPALKSRASAIDSFGPELEREGERMIALMHDAMGVGLAASQIGVLRRMLVFQAGPDATPRAIVNPELEWLSAEAEVLEEGCLSLPRIAVDVERSLHARVRARDLQGEPLTLEASGLEARVLQHEIDHLDGVLMIDRTKRSQRRAALRALREGTAYSPDLEPEPDAEPQPDPEPA
ncbi:MAG: peptide deformylase [Solirubrobacterales bacterium]|nr:peptide deformylase [Solirubrobacterales bacterium]